MTTNLSDCPKSAQHCFHFSTVSKAIMLGKTVHEPEKLVYICCWCGATKAEELPNRNGDPATPHGPYQGLDLANPAGFTPLTMA